MDNCGNSRANLEITVARLRMVPQPPFALDPRHPRPRLPAGDVRERALGRVQGLEATDGELLRRSAQPPRPKKHAKIMKNKRKIMKNHAKAMQKPVVSVTWSLRCGQVRSLENGSTSATWARTAADERPCSPFCDAAEGRCSLAKEYLIEPI